MKPFPVCDLRALYWSISAPFYGYVAMLFKSASLEYKVMSSIDVLQRRLGGFAVCVRACACVVKEKSS